MCHMAIPAVIGLGLQLANTAAQSSDNAQDAREEAKELAAEGARRAGDIRRRSARDVSRQRMALLKGGVTDAGSPTDTLADLAREGGREAYWAEHGLASEARRKQREAARARRRGVLDALGSTNNLGANLIEIFK